MAYGKNVIERAKSLYILGDASKDFSDGGLNYEQIASILKTDYPKITSNTIKNWAETPDEHNETWEDKRKRKLQQVEQKMLAKADSRYEIMYSQVSKLSDLVYDNIEKKLTDSSINTTVNDFVGLQKFILHLEEAKNRQWNPNGIAEQLLKVFYSDKKVAKVLDERMPLLAPKIYAILNEKPQEKEVTE